jgi:hypothetical protein
MTSTPIAPVALNHDGPPILSGCDARRRHIPNRMPGKLGEIERAGAPTSALRALIGHWGMSLSVPGPGNEEPSVGEAVGFRVTGRDRWRKASLQK